MKVIFKKILILCLFLFLLSFWALAAFNWYLKSNTTKMLEELDWLNGASLSFESLDIDLFSNFPELSLHINQVLLCDSLYQKHQTPLLKAEEANIQLSLKDYWQDTIRLKALNLSTGTLSVFSDSNAYNNLSSFLPKQRQDSIRAPGKKLLTNKLKIDLKNIALTYSDIPKEKTMGGTINQMALVLNFSKKDTTINSNMDVQLKGLLFNPEKGAFLKDCSIKGKLSANIKEDKLAIPFSNLQVNQQKVGISANFFLKDQAPHQIHLENEQSNFSQSRLLLSTHLQEKLKDIELLGRFYSNTLIEGSFAPGENPKVQIDFSLCDNEANLMGYAFDKILGEGRFKNWIDPTQLKIAESPKNVALSLFNVSTKHKDFRLASPKMELLIPGEDILLKSKLAVSGPAASISDWFKSKPYQFVKGDFQLKANIDASVLNPKQLLTSTEALLSMNNLDILYPKADVRFNFKKILLEKKDGNAEFELISGALDPNYDLLLEGMLENFPALVLADYEQPLSSDFDLKIKHLSWKNLLRFFGANGKELKSLREQKKSLKTSLSGLYQNFQPGIIAAIDTLEYLKLLKLSDFKTGIYFKNKDTLVLEETRFYHDRGLVSVSATIDISQPDYTPFELHLFTEHLNLQKLLPPLNYFGIRLLEDLDSLPSDLNLWVKHKGVMNDELGLIYEENQGTIRFNDGKNHKISGSLKYQPAPDGLDTKIELEGTPDLINNFLNSETFLFQEGHFSVRFAFQGDIDKVDQLLKESNIQLLVEASEIYYQPEQVLFPIKKMRVDVEKDKANFFIDLQSDSLDRTLFLSGNLENMHTFLFQENAQDKFKVETLVYSPKFHGQDIRRLILNRNRAEKNNEKEVQVASTVRALLQRFNPKVKVLFDTLVFSKQLELQQFHTGLHLKDRNKLILEETGFDFYKGSMDVKGSINLSDLASLPYQVEVKTKDLDLGSFLKSLDYFDIPALQASKELNGKLSMQMELQSSFGQKQKSFFNPDTKGHIFIQLEETEIVALPFIKALAKKIHKKRRFEVLKFQPISDTLFIEGSKLEIPRIELQSNAIHLFVEGEYMMPDTGNIWISLPVSNLKKPNLDIIPEKTGYEFAGDKVFLEVNFGKNTGTKTKFRTSKRKYYKQRNKRYLYKIEKRRDRARRKKQTYKSAFGN